ncbi:MAG: hypothetical protein JW759_01295 [Candidatus Coatesbacteria bacterium]|nr:hypothetical protein [Candidatus Coatesbacteria bacterium]
MTMHPEIRCKYEDRRWKLLPRAEVAPAPVFKEVEPAGARVEPVLQHVPGMLWKRADGYFKIDDPINRPSDRYVPTKIRGYRFEQNGPGSSVDAQNEEPMSDGYAYCGPNNEAPGASASSRPLDVCTSSIPAHDSEPIGEIELAPLSPAEAFLDITEMDDVLNLEEGEGDDLCED